MRNSQSATNLLHQNTRANFHADNSEDEGEFALDAERDCDRLDSVFENFDEFLNERHEISGTSMHAQASVEVPPESPKQAPSAEAGRVDLPAATNLKANKRVTCAKRIAPNGISKPSAPLKTRNDQHLARNRRQEPLMGCDLPIPLSQSHSHLRSAASDPELACAERL